jgi:hypothetical protein
MLTRPGKSGADHPYRAASHVGICIGSVAKARARTHVTSIAVLKCAFRELPGGRAE